MDDMSQHIQASVRAIPYTGVSGNIPVYQGAGRKRVGNAAFDKETGGVEIELTDPDMIAMLQKDILTSVSLGPIAFSNEPEPTELRWRDINSSHHNKKAKVWCDQPGLIDRIVVGYIRCKADGVVPILETMRHAHTFAGFYKVEIL